MAEKKMGISFNRTGPGLKPLVNEADTGSVVNSVRGAVVYGRQRVSGNDPKRNPLVSANASNRRRK